LRRLVIPPFADAGGGSVLGVVVLEFFWMEEVVGTMEVETAAEGLFGLVIALFELMLGCTVLLVPMEDDARGGRRVVLVVGLIALGLGDCGTCCRWICIGVVIAAGIGIEIGAGAGTGGARIGTGAGTGAAGANTEIGGGAISGGANAGTT